MRQLSDEAICWLSFASILLAHSGVGFLLAGPIGMVLGAFIGTFVAPIVAFMVVGTWLVDRRAGYPGSGL